MQQPSVSPAPHGSHGVALSNGKNFFAHADESLLAAAARAGIAMPYSCKTGRCSTCKCKVISGATTALQDETGLSKQEQAEGWILSCVRAPASALVLEAEDLSGVQLPPARTLACRISSVTALAPDVMQVQLRLPPNAQFSCLPGQYVDVIGQGGVRRSYSVANVVSSAKTIELHIRAVEDGHMSRYWFEQAQVNDLLRLHGPLGTFFLRDTADADLVLLATGTGIAPVKAILESLPGRPADQQPKSVTVVWGGRVPSDLYFDVQALAGTHHFIATLSRAGLEWCGARGYVQDALMAHLPDLGNAIVYACGSDAMIHSAQQALAGAGLAPNRFYSDAFVCSSAQLSNEENDR